MASRLLVPFSTGRSLFAGDPLLELHREMNRWFDDMFRSVGAPGGAASLTAPMALVAPPRIDVRESGNELCIVADVPGVDPKDIDLQLDGDTLVLSGEKKNENQQQQPSYHVMERSYGRFQRVVQLPFAPDPGQVQASFEHGVLTVRLPKQGQQPRTHRIEVRSGGSSLEAPSSPAGQPSSNANDASNATAGAGAGSSAGGDMGEVLTEGMSAASDGTGQGSTQRQPTADGADRATAAA